MEIAHRRGDLGVPEHSRQTNDISALLRIARGKGVPETVKTGLRDAEPRQQ
jgi:hypothetical protein